MAASKLQQAMVLLLELSIQQLEQAVSTPDVPHLQALVDSPAPQQQVLLPLQGIPCQCCPCSMHLAQMVRLFR
jgi:hypothetical protein